jgi:phosphoglycolate phosphatase-like HAD superfamily hydrolase
MKTVCLFDIDGTLLNSGGAGQHAMEEALAEVFQVAGPYQKIPYAGRTDRAISADLFAHHGLSIDDEQHWRRFLEAYLRHLPRTLAEHDGVILPGIPELLELLAPRPDTALGLLTGNFQVGAQLKLQHYEIDHYFGFGGYGDEHFDRDDVARLAHQAACDFLEGPVNPDRLWVIGDTPADIRCGRAIGAKTIAVATGVFAAEELEPSRPDHLYESLADVEQVLRVMLG